MDQLQLQRPLSKAINHLLNYADDQMTAPPGYMANNVVETAYWVDKKNEYDILYDAVLQFCTILIMKPFLPDIYDMF